MYLFHTLPARYTLHVLLYVIFDSFCIVVSLYSILLFAALKLDYPRVIDTAFIFRFENQPLNRRLSLNNLCEASSSNFLIITSFDNGRLMKKKKTSLDNVRVAIFVFFLSYICLDRLSDLCYFNLLSLHIYFSMLVLSLAKCLLST